MTALPGAPHGLDELRAHPYRRSAGGLCFLQHLQALEHARQSLLARYAVTVELDVAVAHAHPKVEPAPRASAEICGDRGQPARVVHRKEQHSGADAQAFRDREDGSGCRQQRGTVPVVKEVMLGQPELVVAQPFHEDGKLAHVTVCSGPMPRLHRRALEAEEPDSESHRSSASD